MAIFVTQCAICHKKITEETPFLSTWGIPDGIASDLVEYCDAGIHQECLYLWDRRHEFSEAYRHYRYGRLLAENEKWSLYCGPLGYSHGKVELPDYAELRPSGWPIRLYARFEEWNKYIGNDQWKAHLLEVISEELSEIIQSAPSTVLDLLALLEPIVVDSIRTGSNHKSRYIAVLALDLFPQLTSEALHALEIALNDEHASVRQAARTKLKKIGKPPRHK